MALVVPGGELLGRLVHTDADERIAPARGALTARAARWATMAVGRDARPVADVAADRARVGAVRALGLDETQVGRHGRWRTRSWCMSIVDVHRGQLLDIVPGRDAAGPTVWLLAQPEAWRENIDWGVLDLSGAYRRAFESVPPQAGQVADPFHVVRVANHSINEVRRRTQNGTFGVAAAKTIPPIGRAAC